MAKAVAKTKVKKKKWMSIHAPKSFNSVFLGETHVQEANSVLNKSVTMNLMVLLDDPKKQHYTIRFDVTQVKDGKADTQVIGLKMNPSSIKRLIRRRRDRIDDSFVVRIAGGRLVRVKPMLITRNLSSKAAQTDIRLTVRGKLRDHFQKMKFDDIVHDLIEMKTQRMVKDICNKTHPLRSVEIREIIVLPQDRKLTKEAIEEMEKEAAEESTRREQLQQAAAAAAVDADEPPKKTPKKKAAPKKPIEGPEDPGV